MWAYQLAGPMRLVRRDISGPPADPPDGQVTLRFLAGGVCGSDVARWKTAAAATEPGGTEPVGRHLHEIVGEVESSRSDLAVGDRVVGWATEYDGLREYVTTSAAAVAVVDERLDNVHAVAAQPLACVLHAVGRIPDIAGRRVAVIGLGPIGLLFAHVLRHAGVASVHGVDVVDRSPIASDFGLDHVTFGSSAPWSSAPGLRDSFDLVVEAVGHQVGTVDHAITATAPEGHVLCFGNPDDDWYPVRFRALMDKHITLVAGRTPASARRGALRRAQQYLATYPDLQRAFVTHRLAVGEVQKAFEMADRPAPNQVKIVLEPPA
jgi:L-iditol 2-dehydrogenase